MFTPLCGARGSMASIVLIKLNFSDTHFSVIVFVYAN